MKLTKQQRASIERTAKILETQGYAAFERFMANNLQKHAAAVLGKLGGAPMMCECGHRENKHGSRCYGNDSNVQASGMCPCTEFRPLHTQGLP